MKKITLILAALAVCMSMLLTGCIEGEASTGNNNNGNGGGASNSADKDNDKGNDKDDDKDDGSDDADDGDDDNDSDDSSGGSSGGSGTYSHSSFDANGKFTSTFLGIGADFPTDTWITYTDEELAEYNGGKSTEEELRAALESGGMVYEMMVGKESGSNINIVIQNISIVGEISEEEYIDVSLLTIEDQLEMTGTMSDPHAVKNTVSFGGATRYCLDVTGTTMGIDLYERLVCIKVGDYIGIVTMTTMSESERDEFTAMFYSL